MSSACDSCPSKEGCTSQSTCPSAMGKDPLANGSSIKTVIGVASGKVGIMDADVTGPSIPQSFGLNDNLRANDDQLIEPALTSTGIKTVSVNLVLEDKEAPVIWRGPVLNSLIKQFWGQVNWETLDVLLIDMPPGTGDVPLTVFQSIPIDGIILVATSQDNKARNMASMMKVPVLGMVENMSFIKCPHCGDEIRLYGDGSSIEKSASEIGSKVTDKIPLDPGVTKLVDSGRAEEVSEELLSGTTEMIIELIKK